MKAATGPATITITIPEAQTDRVLAPYAMLYGYIPETDGALVDFVKAQIIKQIKATVIDYESRPAAKDAKTKIAKEVEGILIN
jgi:hypothetical protein